MGVVDILVVGAGPAGCLAAIAARQTAPALSVALVDRDLGPRHRIGEIFLTQAVVELHRLGLAERLRAAMARHGWIRKYGGTYTYGANRTPWVVTNDHPALARGSEDEDYPDCFRDEKGLRYTFTAPRHELDMELRAMAADAGARLIEGQVARPRLFGRDSETVITEMTVETATGALELRPSFVIDATGQYALISRTMKTRQRMPRKVLSARYGYFGQIDMAGAVDKGFPREMPHLISVGTGWCWVAELRPGMVSIGVVSDDWSCGFDGWLDRISELKTVFGLDRSVRLDHDGQPAAPDHHYVHPDYSYESGVRYGRNWTSVGDAAIFLDPLLSQGASLALAFGRRAGKLAANALIGEGDTDVMLKTLHEGYKKEVAIFNHLVSIWYQEDDSPLIPRWQEAARRIAHAFGRSVEQDHNALRWIANMENIHLLLDGGTELDVLALASGWDDPTVMAAE